MNDPLPQAYIPTPGWRRVDDPGDSCWTWPFWKFGFKRDDLFGSLHDHYNTIASPILDPEAFHHDVYEISQKASTKDEFHQLLQARKEQRLRELNETLESAAFEIIANPSLIGTEQWKHAVQLFRTKSLDSLVRYYASYLPSDHPWYKSDASHSDAGSSAASTTDSHGTTLFDDEHIVDEPLEEEFDYDYPPYSRQENLVASPRSMTICSDSSVASPAADEPHDFDYASPPARSLSFSESEPDCCAMPGSRQCSCSGSPESLPTADKGVQCDNSDEVSTDDQDSSSPPENDTTPTPSASSNISDTNTPTPRPDNGAASYFTDTKSSPDHYRRHRSTSPAWKHPLSNVNVDQLIVAHRESRKHRGQPARRARECSPADGRRSRSATATRIRKPQPDVVRTRLRGRKLADS
ncbi:hypothetical protein VTJ04DRAFT_1917 [Mycothermus thermophilus]|uniref:uncharacterized protein n=1 Tax=Humicola insolens TaxID=85995 RepID=UPI0037427D23